MKFYSTHKKKKIFATFLLVIFVLGALLSFNAGRRPEKFEYGVTFSHDQASALGLDWQEVYRQTLADLGVKHLRLSAYWNQIEPDKDKFNFDKLDFQIKLAEEHRALVVLSVGRRLPRWPECHEPGWLKDVTWEKGVENEQMAYIEEVVRRYQNSPAVKVWQVENEPFLSSFGECPKPDAGLLDREIALVKKLDPTRPVLISDSGELSLWIHSGKRGDIFGTTLYRYVFSDIFKRYWVNYIPYWFYRVKGGFLRLLNPGKKIVIIELQAEPWTTKGILNTPIDEQFRTMSMQKFEKLLSVAKATGFSPQYLWGVEWWYWMKTQNHPEFWEKSKQLFKP
jgi:hypothetical protein